MASDEHDCDEIDAITVRTFGRGASYTVRGVNAELMRFYKPSCRFRLERRAHIA